MLISSNKIFIRFVFLVFGYSCFFSCSSETNIVGPIWTMGKFHDAYHQKKFIDSLKIYDIKYRYINNEYFIFSINDLSNVLRIERETVYGKELNSNIEEGFLIGGKEVKIFYERALSDAGIPYRVLEIEGVVNTWSINYFQNYGPEVDEIRQEVEIELKK